LTQEQIQKYYKITPDPDEKNRACVLIEHGPFAGITVSFGKFQLAENENEDGSVKARYEYEMIGIPPDFEGKEFSDEEGENFEYMLGQIYIHILNEQLEKQKEESEDGTTRKYDFTKPVI
tara:strand:+ start:269 stop:628 length:360 start_codon:yes stop_codon:yes gene_type:complete